MKTRVESLARAERLQVRGQGWIPVKDRVYPTRPSESGVEVIGVSRSFSDLLVVLARLHSRRGDRHGSFIRIGEALAMEGEG